MAVFDYGHKMRKVDRCDICKVFSVDAGRRAVRMEEACAERREHAEAGVICRAAANADDEVAAAAFGSGEDEFAEAVCRRVKWVALRGGHHGKPRCISHFDDGGLVLREEAEAARYLFAERPCDRDGDDLAREPFCQRVNRAFASIGEREDARLAVREDVVDGRCNDAAAFDG